MTTAIRVLLVEDHVVTLYGLKVGLMQEPDIAVVGSAGDSDSGLAMARELKPDVIILDLHLPGSMQPKALLSAFCSLEGARVLVFSSDSRTALVETVVNAGVAGYLLKSEGADRVAHAIRQAAAGGDPVYSSELISRGAKISNAEEHLLRMLARGMKYEDMAQRRVTSQSTVRKQCESLQEKLNLKSREELIAWAERNGYGHLELDS